MLILMEKHLQKSEPLTNDMIMMFMAVVDTIWIILSYVVNVFEKQYFYFEKTACFGVCLEKSKKEFYSGAFG